uniref:Actin like 9 n=1 Tax=Sphenodon punctatus TaxID=8508 RepID=A0A8D0GY70_SPHPU
MDPGAAPLEPSYPSLRSVSYSSDPSLKAKGTTAERAGSSVVKKTGAVVIDTGTGKCKAGFAGQQKPKSIISTLVGHPSEKSMRLRNDRPDTFVGERARSQPDVELIQPVMNGIIIDWEAAEALWRHIFYHDLKVPPEEHALLMSDPPLCPTTNREKLVEVVFESLHSPGMYVAYQSVLSEYGHGKISGLVVDTGYAVTHTVPVHQGYNLPHATERMDIAGSHMTSFLIDLLKDSGHMFNERMLHVLEDIKHKCCYVAADFESEWNLPKKEYMLDFQLPDGQVINIGKERFQCPEMLFSPPNMPGLSLVGLPGMAYKSLKKVPEEVRKEMYQNILLFTTELAQKLPTNTKIKVAAIPLRKYSVWTGGSILASLKNFQSCWIRKEQYKEHGPYIVYRKCY